MHAWREIGAVRGRKEWLRVVRPHKSSHMRNWSVTILSCLPFEKRERTNRALRQIGRRGILAFAAGLESILPYFEIATAYK